MFCGRFLVSADNFGWMLMRVYIIYLSWIFSKPVISFSAIEVQAPDSLLKRLNKMMLVGYCSTYFSRCSYPFPQGDKDRNLSNHLFLFEYLLGWNNWQTHLFYTYALQKKPPLKCGHFL